MNEGFGVEKLMCCQFGLLVFRVLVLFVLFFEFVEIILLVWFRVWIGLEFLLFVGMVLKFYILY